MDEDRTLLANILSMGDWATWKTSIDQVDACLNTWESKAAKTRFQRILSGWLRLILLRRAGRQVLDRKICAAAM